MALTIQIITSLPGGKPSSRKWAKKRRKKLVRLGGNRLSRGRAARREGKPAGEKKKSKSGSLRDTDRPAHAASPADPEAFCTPVFSLPSVNPAELTALFYAAACGPVSLSIQLVEGRILSFPHFSGFLRKLLKMLFCMEQIVCAELRRNAMTSPAGCGEHTARGLGIGAGIFEESVTFFHCISVQTKLQKSGSGHKTILRLQVFECF